MPAFSESDRSSRRFRVEQPRPADSRASDCRSARPASGNITIWSMVASTASKNSTPRCCRWSSYHPPATRYSASASSSKRTCGFTADCEVQSRRVAGRLTKGYRPIHRRSRGGPVARFPPPRQLRLLQDYLLQQRPGWPTIPRRHRRVRRSAMSALRAEVPGLARSCLILHPGGRWPLAK
jgi:hypothetical protein